MNQNNLSTEKLMEIISVQTEVAQLGMDLAGIMDLVTRRTQQITRASGASVELIEKDELVYRAATGMAEKFLGLRLKIDNSLSGLSISGRVPLMSSDIEIDDRVNKEACRKIGLNSMIVVPLIYREEVVGILKVLSAQADYFGDGDIKVLELMSGLIAAEMFRAIRNDENDLLYKATHDSLTGISNRAFFYDRLRQKLSTAVKQCQNFGIITLDMDGLKEINDGCGHRAGDAAIKELAARLSRSVRESDTVSRLGGDEFGVIVAAVPERNYIRSLIHLIDSEVTKPFEFEGNELKLRASIGYALFSEDGIELEVLVEKADKSMYESKRERKGLNNTR